MSYLLGSEYCIQSLSSDVSDVQSAIKDVLCKTGRINSISWKFPDKFACELNIDEYLNQYRFDSSDNENNQVSHIVLLELIIDRLGLMLQLNCEFIDNLLCKGNSKDVSIKSVKQKIDKTVSPCLGLSSKKHWSKMSQLSIHIDNLEREILREKKINKELSTELESMKSMKSMVAEAERANESAVLQDASAWLKAVDNEHRSIFGNKNDNKSISGSISKDTGYKSSQTIDTAFRPCESCHIAQTAFRETSAVVTQILAEESQTSLLSKLNEELRSMDWLSDKKLLQVKDSFVKDFDKICKFYRDIRKKERKVNEEFNVCRKGYDQLKQEFTQEREKTTLERSNFQNQKVDLESQIKCQTNNVKMAQSEIHSMTNEFNNKYRQLQKEVADLSAKLVEVEKDRFQLEKLKIALTDFKLQSENPLEGLSVIKKKLEDQTEQIMSLNLTIQNQRVANNNLSEIEHVAAEKENNLMKRLKQLSDQKHKLEEKIDVLGSKLEDANSRVKEIDNQNREISLEMEDKMTLIDNLTNKKEKFNEKILELQNQVSHMEDVVMELEKEKMLLIHYPDLDGPLERFDSGNVTEDIQMQIKANGARIRILSQQNADLGNALAKLQLNGDQAKDNCSAAPHRSDSRMSSETVRTQSDLKLIISRPASNHSSTFQPASKNRPPRHFNPTKSVISESPSHVLQWSTTTQKSATPTPCVCETCGRQYQQKADMEIHKEYCAGRRRKNNQK